MQSKNCGNIIPAGGTEVKGQKATENIYLCADGKYRWVYEFEMLKNPSLLFTIWKVLGFSFGIVFLFVFLLLVFDGNMGDFSDFWSLLLQFLLITLIVMALAVPAYLIIAGSYGWRYTVLFTMDEEGIEHRQMKKQFDKARALGWITAAAGLASGNATVAGTGILAATRDTSTSIFANVRTVKSSPARHIIYVNQILNHNQIYAESPDFDFVRDFIIRHCVNARKIS